VPIWKDEEGAYKRGGTTGSRTSWNGSRQRRATTSSKPRPHRPKQSCQKREAVTLALRTGASSENRDRALELALLFLTQMPTFRGCRAVAQRTYSGRMDRIPDNAVLARSGRSRVSQWQASASHAHPSRRSMYQRAMGDSFDGLAPAIKRFHQLSGSCALRGWVETQKPASFLASLMARALGTSRDAGTGPLRLKLDAAAETETWTRRFPRRTMISRLELNGSEVDEVLGPTRLSFGLVSEGSRLVMHLRKMRFFGICCPRWLMPSVVAEEIGEGDLMHFRAEARLPLIGVVASYHGHLVIPREGSMAHYDHASGPYRGR
jgi:hypothetical protein